MSDVTRPYRSPRREQHAQQTRQDVLTTARELFVSVGYARVTMSDIARSSGVAVKTVYASVGTKTDVLHELLLGDVAAGSAGATVDGIRDAPDLRTALDTIAAGTRADTERFKPSIDLLHSSMASDEGAHRIWAQVVTEYRGGLRAAAELLVEAGLVATDLDTDAVTDRLWFCFGLGAWRSLVDECGWTYDEAERWLSRQAQRALTEPGPDRGALRRPVGRDAR